MPEQMYALCLDAPNDLKYVQIEKPAPALYEVLCRIESVSICGTDPHIINGDFPGFWPQSFPLIPGHEWAGVVVELGEKAENFGWKIGDRVCGIANLGCGHCKNCMEGRFTICLNYGKQAVHKMYGHITQGAYAQYMAVNIRSIAKIPDDMNFDIAACMDPLSIALHVVMHSRIEPGDSVLVMGAGAQGLMSILCARSMGAGVILCAGSGERLREAERLGAIPIDYKTENVVERVMQLTGGLGAKRIMECSGTAEGVRNACFSAARGGVISAVGFPKEDVPIPVKRLVLDEIEFVGNRANPNTLEKAITIAYRYREELQRFITDTYPLSQYREAFKKFTGRQEGTLKIVLKPQQQTGGAI